jgi:uncharacterized membrane protein (DUF2068 family)
LTSCLTGVADPDVRARSKAASTASSPLWAGTLRELGIVLLVYALLEGLEAVGLWLTKRWAEYLSSSRPLS